jgi:hypothetical protein
MDIDGYWIFIDIFDRHDSENLLFNGILTCLTFYKPSKNPSNARLKASGLS